jgi:DNA-binding CsgD family transcriptional regulator
MEAHLAMGGGDGRTRRRRSGQATADRAERLRERYALTAQEARVAVLIADGVTVKEIAAFLEVTVFTVRAHLRNIFAKMGVARQAALVRVVLTTTSSRHIDSSI